MKKEEIYLWDIKRIIFGQAPPEFMLEVLLRALIVYIVALVVIRLMGKRMSGQLTITEMAVMITLGAMISVPMQIPDRGVLTGLTALFCALLFQRGINWLGFKNEKVERVTQGNLSLLVKDGVLLLHEMQKSAISKQQLFAALRNKKIHNLGKVKRMYLEGCGKFSIYEAEAEQPGLPVFPPSDTEVLHTQRQAPGSKVVCINCGTLQSQDAEQTESCALCGHKEWAQAIV